MKKTALFILIGSLALGLGSCYWRPEFSSGGLRVDLSRISSRVGGAGDVIRVYLIADGLLFSAGGGGPFLAEVPASGDLQEQKIGISGLPVGPQYQVLVGVGPVNSGVFTPQAYGESELFLVSPHADTPVPISLAGIPFSGSIAYSTELMGRKLVSVVDSGGVVAAESRALHYTYLDTGTFPYTLAPPQSYDLSSDPNLNSHTINGLSRGGFRFTTWMNTSNGIVPFTVDGWGNEPGFSADLSGSKDILESGSFSILGAGFDFLFFRRANGLGGNLAVNGTPSNTWVNLDVPEVRDLAIGSSTAFFATGGGAFALPAVFLQDALPDLAARRVPIPAPPLPILCLDLRTGTPGTLYMGTADGVWYMSADEAKLTFGSPTPLTRVPETAGARIEQIAVHPTMVTSDNQAYLSRYWLFIRTFGTVYRIPFFAVFPGKPTGLAWDSAGVLYISGTEGLSAVYVGGS